MELMSDEATQKIEQHLDPIFDKFINLFPGKLQQDIMRQSSYFAGGCIVSLLQGEKIQDYDIFLTDEQAVDVAKSYFDSMCIFTDEIVANTENAITVRLPGVEAVVQIVTRFYGNPDRVFSSFDFEHCKTFYIPHAKLANYDLDLIVNKKLVYTGEKDQFPLNTLKRFGKYCSRGYTPDNESVINLVRACGQIDIDDPEVARVQKVGFYGSSFK